VVRLVLEFLGEASDQRWPSVQHALEAAGARSIGIPPTRSPLLVTALLPDDGAGDDVLDGLRALDGVGRVELDAMRETYVREEGDGARE
jgi:hypothetical protein